MSLPGHLRHNLSAFILWCAFLALYLGGAVLLVIGLFFAGRTWWARIHRHAGLWTLSMKTGELVLLAVGFLLVLIIPLLPYRTADRSELWRKKRRSGVEKGSPVTGY